MAQAQLTTGVTVSYAEHGSGDPPLLLVHGWACDAEDWKWQVPVFAARHRLIVPELRGHGASSVPAGGYAPADYAGDLVELLALLDPGPVVAIGHSMSAIVLSNLARQRPDLLAGAVLVDPTYGDDAETGAQIASFMRRLDAEGDIEAAADAVGAREAQTASAELQAWHRERLLALPPHVVTRTLVELHASPDQPMYRPQVDSVLRERAVPLLVFHTVPGRAAWEAGLQTDPRSRVVDWAGSAGHWAHQERPDDFNRIVLDWIADLS
jgi:pimeloyl-ACP methyl ester carboxylesterase